MDTSALPSGCIVVGVDGSEHSDAAVDWAATQATLEGRPLAVVHCMSPESPWNGLGLDYAYYRDAVDASARQVLARATDRARTHTGLEVVAARGLDDPRDDLVVVSERAAMLVLGSRGRGPVARLLLGSVSASVSRHARCPVVVTRTGAPPSTRVVVAVDGRPECRGVVELGFRLASVRGLPLSVVHCFWDVAVAEGRTGAVGADEPGLDDLRLLVAESVAGFGSTHPDVPVTVELDRDLVDRALTGESRASDLVVVGHQPRHGIGRFVHGAVSLAVLERAAGPVVVVPEGIAAHQRPS